MSNINEKDYIELESHETLIFTLNPKHSKIWNIYEKQQSILWLRNELNLSFDNADFSKLNSKEQYFIKSIISFFAVFDSIVNLNISKNIAKKVTIMEYRYFMNIQQYIEGVHAEVYKALLDCVTTSDKEKELILNSWKTNKHLFKLVNLALKWVNSEKLLNEYIIAFAFVEGVLFSGAFASIEWLRVRSKTIYNEKGKQFMQGLCHSNEFIARDESLHVEAAVELYKLSTKKLSVKNITNIALEFTEAAKSFMKDALNTDIIGLKSESLLSHIEFCANNLIKMLGYNFVLYKNAQSLEYMNTFGSQKKVNFFERTNNEYISNVNDSYKTDDKNGKLDLLDNF